MPAMNGLQFAEQVREFSDLPIIIYTAHGSEEIAEKAYKTGINGYIRKELEPAHFQVVVNRVKNLVSQYRAEKALKQRTQELDVLVTNSLDAILQINLREDTVKGNPAFYKILGYSPEEIDSMGKGFLSLVHEDDLKHHLRELEFLRDLTADRYFTTSRWRRKDGEYVTLESSVCALTEDDELVGVNVIARDVSEKRQIFQELRNSEWRLRERNKELNLIYKVKEILDKLFPPEETFNEVVELIPEGWQYPEDTIVWIIVDSVKCTTHNFRRTPWKQTADIIANGRQRGMLEVFYAENKAVFDEGPFLKEERKLLNFISFLIGDYLEKLDYKQLIADPQGLVLEEVENIPEL